MALDSVTFAMVVAAAFMHASWNLIARRYKGNVSMLALGTTMVVCLLGLVEVGRAYRNGKRETLGDLGGTGVPYGIASGTVHGLYLWLLAKGYELGLLSVVYPIARGSGVALAALLGLAILHTSGAHYSVEAIVGVVSVCVGIAFIGLPAKNAGRFLGQFLLTLQPRVALISTTTPPVSAAAQGLEGGPPSAPRGAVVETNVDEAGGSEATEEDESEPGLGESDTMPLIPEDTTESTTRRGPLPPPRVCVSEGPPSPPSPWRVAAVAAAVGMCTAAYSVLDSSAVETIDPIFYIILRNGLTVVVMLPGLLCYRREELLETLRSKKGASFAIGIGMVSHLRKILTRLT